MDSIENLLKKDTLTVAKELIGWELYSRKCGDEVGGIIIETEAYLQNDPASHSYKGKTARNSAMYQQAGTVYVYFTYGMHWCMNVVTGPAGRGEAVLIRAIEPTRGLRVIKQRRHNRPDKELTNGPAKVCRALAVTGEDNEARLNEEAVFLKQKNNHYPTISNPRVGIQKNKHALWRFSRN